MGGSLLPPSVLLTATVTCFVAGTLLHFLRGRGGGVRVLPGLFRKRMAYPLPYVFKVQGNFEFQTITGPKFSIYFR